MLHVREVLTTLNCMAHVGRDSALQAQVGTRSKAAWRAPTRFAPHQ